MVLFHSNEYSFSVHEGHLVTRDDLEGPQRTQTHSCPQDPAVPTIALSQEELLKDSISLQSPLVAGADLREPGLTWKGTLCPPEMLGTFTTRTSLAGQIH